MKKTFKHSTIVVIMAGVILFANTLCWAEFQVNTHTANWQYRPAVAMDPFGNFVAVWSSAYQDGSSGGIYGQRFDTNGGTLGSEFRINVTTAENQKTPDIGMDPSGNLVVSWASTDADGYEDIYARRYNSSGVPLTGEFLVNTYTTKRQLVPSVGMNDSGAFVITWQSSYGTGGDHDPPDWTACGRKYNSSGVPLGQEFIISQEIAGLNPDVAMDDSGEFTVAYYRTGDSDDLPEGNDLRMRRYNSDGTPKNDPVPFVADAGGGIKPSIAMDGSANFAIAWADYVDDEHGRDVYYQRFDSDGNPLSGQFIVNTNRPGMQGTPGIAMNDDGEALIVWPSGSVGGRDVFGQSYDSDFLPIGSEFPINTYTDGDQGFPAVAMNNDGRFVVVWQSDGQDGDDWGIFAETGSIFKLGLLPADFDLDGDVDGVDFSHWQIGYPTASGATLSDGDADGDGDVDGADFGIWQANYPTNLGGSAAIPEPATLSLLLIGGLALSTRSRLSLLRRRHSLA